MPFMCPTAGGFTCYGMLTFVHVIVYLQIEEDASQTETVTASMRLPFCLKQAHNFSTIFPIRLL